MHLSSSGHFQSSSPESRKMGTSCIVLFSARRKHMLGNLLVVCVCVLGLSLGHPPQASSLPQGQSGYPLVASHFVAISSTLDQSKPRKPNLQCFTHPRSLHQQLCPPSQCGIDCQNGAARLELLAGLGVLVSVSDLQAAVRIDVPEGSSLCLFLGKGYVWWTTFQLHHGSDKEKSIHTCPLPSILVSAAQHHAILSSAKVGQL